MEHPDRVPGLTPDEMAEDARRLLGVTVTRVAGDEVGSGAPPRTKPLHILTVMAHHPRFLGPFIEWATALAQHGLLTRREQEILALVAEGRSNRSIAEALAITPKTIEGAIGIIFSKLGRSSRRVTAMNPSTRVVSSISSMNGSR